MEASGTIVSMLAQQKHTTNTGSTLTCIQVLWMPSTKTSQASISKVHSAENDSVQQQKVKKQINKQTNKKPQANKHAGKGKKKKKSTQTNKQT